MEQDFRKFLPPNITYKDIGRLHEKHNQIIREYGSQGIKIIDLENGIHPNYENFIYVIHFSENGNKFSSRVHFLIS